MFLILLFEDKSVEAKENESWVISILKDGNGAVLIAYVDSLRDGVTNIQRLAALNGK